MAIHDTGRFGFQDPRVGFDVWFAVMGFIAAYWACGCVEGLRVCVYLQGCFPLLWGLGYDPFLGVSVGDVVLCAEVVEEVAAVDAERCF